LTQHPHRTHSPVPTAGLFGVPTFKERQDVFC
jgi:hypothetical protein